jgi:hydrophobic/amphiphilic exporter-1 (mainly G- bacteria), HAE1 family
VFLSDISIKRPVMITMVMVALLLYGVIAYKDLPLNQMPDAKIPFLTIQTVYPGAGPEQIESLITKKIEDEISAVSRIKSIQSYSINSASIMILEFELDKDPDIASQEVKEKIDAILNDLPEQAQKPLVAKVDISATPVIKMILSGDIESTELFYLADTTIKDSLSRIEGVGSVDIEGGLEREVRIAFDNKTVYENAINLTQVAGILAYANMDMPGGNFQNETEDYAVSLKGEIKSELELEEIMIPTAAGMRKLDQLASIGPMAEDARQRITFFDMEQGVREDNTVLISIVKSSDGNPVEIAEAVNKILPGLKKELPESVSLRITNDDSVFIRDTVNDTLGNIILGIIFTAAILLFFLHDFRSTLIVALTMPLAIIPTFMIMKPLGITINMMSLMGLSTSVGVLVMNSVVVLQNIFRHKEMGHSRKEAASKGTAEVTVAVVASTLTNVCVFLPIGTMDGITGIFLRDFALTVVIATLFSLIISFTLTPMLASLLLPETKKKKNKVSQIIEDFFKSLERAYTFLLEKIIYNRKRSMILIAGTLALFLIAMFGFTKIPFELMPIMDSGDISIEVELPQDASLEQTAELLVQIEEEVSHFPEVKQILTNIGASSGIDSGTNLAIINIKLVDVDMRQSSKILANKISNALVSIPNAMIRVQAVNGMVSGMGGAALTFYLQGNDQKELQKETQLMKSEMESIPGITGIKTSMKSGKPEINIYPNRQKLAELGVTVQDLAMSVRAAIDGIVLTQMKKDSREYDIRVTMSDTEISSYEDIRNIPVSTMNGIYPLSYFGEIAIEEGVSSLLRIDKKSSVEFTADTMPGVALGDVTAAIEQIKADMNSKNVSLKWGGNAEMMQDTVSNMAFAFVMAIILTYMLLAAILEKLGQPILILSTVPLSLIGVVALFLITGLSMNMVSMLAIIMLVGMVVNNAILILEYTNQLRAEGMEIHDALLKACPIKLQPILMANTATILGMLPMALGIGQSGSEMRRPMGLVSIGGLIAATFLSLFIIPALENVIESRKSKKVKKISVTSIEEVSTEL